MAFVLTEAAQAQTFNVIYSFDHGTVGIIPFAGVTLDARGNVYGTNNASGMGYGAVYKLTNRNGSWIASPLYDFQGGMDGAFPASRVIFGPDGALYGTTSEGGGSGCSNHGCGTVFRLAPSPTVCRATLCPWIETVLYRFSGGADGAIPEFGDIIFDSAGAIYGTTSGSNSNFGSVYKLTNSGGVWTETTLWAFTGGADGFFPNGGVVFDRSGNLYGTMNTGVFELSPSGGGWTESVIHTFQYQVEGLSSESNMIFDNAGNLYSSTFTQGPSQDGTVFEMTPSSGSWNLQVIHPVGHTIGSSLNFDAAGNLYGVTITDQSGNGEAFKMSFVDGSWTYSSLHEFTGGNQGTVPYGGMAVDANGNLWGTASGGGAYNLGLVYEITP
ncbi:MAG: choice-of-anchor tandem repeat GloVer-containing protein [Candidatus Korobacteraceae bacterium]